MSQLGNCYRPHPGARFRRVGDEAVVVQQDAAEVLVLNSVGARILDLLDGEETVEQVLEILSAELEVGELELERDVDSFLAELQEARVIERVAGE